MQLKEPCPQIKKQILPGVSTGSAATERIFPGDKDRDKIIWHTMFSGFSALVLFGPQNLFAHQKGYLFVCKIVNYKLNL